jgi:uncharacterized membrane protein YfcA
MSGPSAVPPGLDVFPLIDDPFFYLVAVPAVALMGMAKGGFSGLGLLSMPLLALAVSPVRAAAIMLPILIVQDIVSVWAYRHAFDRRNLAILLPGAVVGIALGWLMAAHVSDAMVTIAVGLISVAFVLNSLRKRRLDAGVAGQGDVTHGLAWGGVSGFTSFIAHAGGPPFQVYVMPQRLDPILFAGTSTMFFAAVNAIKVVPYVALGQFSASNLATSAVLFPLAMASTLVGVWLVKRVDADRFYKIIYGLTFAVGLELLWTGVHAMLQG